MHLIQHHRRLSSRSVYFLYEHEDILVLLNDAGADGWELTNSVGLDDFEWRDRDRGGPKSETR